MGEQGPSGPSRLPATWSVWLHAEKIVSRTCPECANTYEDEILHCPEDGLDLTALEPDDELIGRNIGSYRVVKQLGKGGMGAVYMAEHPVIGSRVAIKFLHQQFSADKKIVDRFFNEEIGRASCKE